MGAKKKPPQWLQTAGEATYNALSGVTNPLYDWSQKTQVPQWLGDIGDAAYMGMSGLIPGQNAPSIPVAEQIRMQMEMEKRRRGGNALADGRK